MRIRRLATVTGAAVLITVALGLVGIRPAGADQPIPAGTCLESPVYVGPGWNAEIRTCRGPVTLLYQGRCYSGNTLISKNPDPPEYVDLAAGSPLWGRMVVCRYYYTVQAWWLRLLVA
jgi:hypothetical protein